MPGAALFGKLPSQLDFQRVHHASELGIEFDAWLQQAVQELSRANLSWPTEPLRGVFAPADRSQALLCVVSASRDRAGRKFPVTVYGSVPAAGLGRALAGVPDACAPFFDAALELLSHAADLARDELGSRLAAVPVPDLASLDSHAEAAAAGLAARSLDALATSTAGRADPSIACQKLLEVLRSRDGAATAMDLPVGHVDDLRAWLFLAGRGQSTAPSLFWSEPGATGRLLVSRGAPPALLPAWFSAPGRRHPRLIQAPEAPAQAAPDAESANLRAFLGSITLKGSS